MRQYLHVLKNPAAVRLMASTFPARLAYSMVGLSIFFHVFQITNSVARAGVAIGINGVTGAVSAGVRGMVMDKYGQTWLLWILVPCYAATLVAMSSIHSYSPLLIIAALLGAFAPPINMSSRPLWKLAVPEGSLRTAYALDMIAMHGVVIFGPILASSISLKFSGSWSLRLCALFIFIGGMALSTSPLSRKWVPEKKDPGTVSLWRSPGIRLLMIEGLCIGFGWGAFDVGLPASATLANQAHLIGPLLSLLGIGTVIGVAIGGIVSKKVSALKAMLTNYAIWVATCLPLLIFHRPTAALFVVAFLIGLAGGPLGIFYWEVLDAVRPKGSAVAALAWIWAFEGSAAAAGAAFAGRIAESAGPGYALASTPIAVLIGFSLIFVGRRWLKAGDRIPSDGESAQAFSESEDSPRANG